MEDVDHLSESFWLGRRVLVTGHTGFKGSWLSLWLARLGAEVCGFADRVPTRPALYDLARVAELVDSVEGDVRDGDAVERAVAGFRPEIVFHLAAQALVRTGYREPVLTFETNVLGTANVLEAARSAGGVQAIVVVTTDKVYEHVSARRYREDDRLGGADPYSASKACAELVTGAFRAAYLSSEDAPATATARAGNVIGGGDWASDRLVPDLVAALLESRPVEIRFPAATRPWQHVLDPLAGYLVLAERLCSDRAAARAWNFGPRAGDARPVEWVVGRFAEEWGAPLEIVSPDGEQPPEAPSLELDASSAEETLGWAPRWGLEQALRATAEWYRAHAEGEDARELTVAQIERYAAEPATAGG